MAIDQRLGFLDCFLIVGRGDDAGGTKHMTIRAHCVSSIFGHGQVPLPYPRDRANDISAGSQICGGEYIRDAKSSVR
jgi:hypothetical protein